MQRARRQKRKEEKRKDRGATRRDAFVERRTEADRKKRATSRRRSRGGDDRVLAANLSQKQPQKEEKQVKEGNSRR